MPSTLSAIAWSKALIHPVGVALPSMTLAFQPIFLAASTMASPHAWFASLLSSFETKTMVLPAAGLGALSGPRHWFCGPA